MMPYMVGRDLETGEITVLDIRTDTFFLRGSQESEQQIRDLVQAANENHCVSVFLLTNRA